MVAAILAFLGGIYSNQPVDIPNFGLFHQILIPILLSFAFILSVIGLRVIVTLSLGYEHYLTDITMITYFWNEMVFYRHPSKPFHFKEVYYWFYMITICLFSFLLSYYVFQSLNWSEKSAFISFAITLVVFTVLLQQKSALWKQKFGELEELREILKKDTERKIYNGWDGLVKKASFRDILEEAKRLQKASGSQPKSKDMQMKQGKNVLNYFFEFNF